MIKGVKIRPLPQLLFRGGILGLPSQRPLTLEVSLGLERARKRKKDLKWKLGKPGWEGRLEQRGERESEGKAM